MTSFGSLLKVTEFVSEYNPRPFSRFLKESNSLMVKKSPAHPSRMPGFINFLFTSSLGEKSQEFSARRV
jgi:hypothetical protein